MSSKIEWTDETWNPITGCTKISAGCANCYAEKMAKRLAVMGDYGYPKDEPFRVTFHPDRLDQPLRWKKPRKVFVCSMGDIFHEDVHYLWLERIFVMMFNAPQHIFMLLTKRPERMYEYLSIARPIPNVWLGVTAENQQAADERIPWLLKTPAVKRFVSVEPMLGPVDLSYPLNGCPERDKYGEWYQTYPYIDWIICGGETGPGARIMDPDWARSLRDQCQNAGVPFFFKKHGNNKKRTLDGRLWEERPPCAAE